MASPSQLKSLAALREAFPELKAEAELNKAYAAAYDKAMVGVPLKERPTLEQWKATTLQTAPTARFQGALPMEHTRSSGQDASTQPVDSQWRAALRSYLAGTAGLPGDLEGLGRQGINAAFGLGGVKVDETPAMPTTEFYKDWLPGKQEGSAPLADAASMLGGAGMLKGIRSVESLGKAIAHAAPGPVAGGKLAQLGVIRNTGDNNFLNGSVENALSGLKSRVQRDAPFVGRKLPLPPNDASLNKFVEGPLTRYVKNHMATPDDPVRALAEQGVLHFDAGITPTAAARAGALRGRAGFAPLGEGKSDLARAWEATSDANIDAYKAKQFQGDALVDNPWLATKPPETNVYGMDVLNPTATADRLGFTHLTDELRNALNPESGLPRDLLLTPEKLQNFGMERAVRHVAAINDWRAAQVAEANAQKANNAATVLHKEYPDLSTASTLYHPNVNLPITGSNAKLLSSYLENSLPLNYALQEGKLTPALTKQAEMLDQLIATHGIEAPQPTLFYRGVNSPDKGKSFLSVTPHKDIAARFGKVEEVRVPKGTKMLPVSGEFTHPSLIGKLSPEGEEAVGEYLLPRGTSHGNTLPNPKGLRWVELKAPDPVLAEGHVVGPVSGYPDLHGIIDSATGQSVSLGATPEEALRLYQREERTKSLSDALKYEGDTMKHCVGGYCDDVLSGQKRIFSLRDAKGEPHVTIHTEPGVPSDSYLKSLPDPDHLTGGDMLVPDSSWSMYDYVHRHRKGNGDFESYANKALAEHGYELPPEKIVQIKRKANLVNSDPYEYRPFVQDFVKSGKWSDVGDLANTGLIKHPTGYLTNAELDALPLAEQEAFASRNVKFATGVRVSMVHPAAAIQPLVRVPGFDRF